MISSSEIFQETGYDTMLHLDYFKNLGETDCDMVFYKGIAFLFTLHSMQLY